MAAGKPQGNADYVELRPVTGAIIGAAIDVNRRLGMGFVEKVYENALVIELKKLGLEVDQQWPVEVRYEDQIVGSFVADLVVQGRVIVELKVASHLHTDFQIQCINYLKATGLNVCLLLNFGRRRLEYKRFVFTHSTPALPCDSPAAICVP